jgi:glycosyltransferase involved in cell wall biosynthesis
MTDVSPFPVNGGERIRSYGLIKALESFGNVYAFVGNEDLVDLSIEESGRLSFMLFNRSKILNNKYLNFIFNYFCRSGKLVKRIDAVMHRAKIDIVFIDYYFLGQYISYFKEKDIPVIYGTHNAQSNLTLQYPTKSFIKMLQKYMSVFLQKTHEKLFFNKADILICVSKKDADFHSKFVSPDKIRIIPNYIDLNRYTRSNLTENYIVMSGYFNAFQNANSLKWFVDKVWNTYKLYKKTRLLLVGKGSDSILSQIKVIDNSISATGTVEDVSQYISKAKISIVPLLYGSGARLKILEAMALNTPIVSTSLGVEGIKHENAVLIGDTPKLFNQHICNLLDDNKYAKKLSEKAYSILLERYTLDVNAQKLKHIIEEVLF